MKTLLYLIGVLVVSAQSQAALICELKTTINQGDYGIHNSVMYSFGKSGGPERVFDALVMTSADAGKTFTISSDLDDVHFSGLVLALTSGRDDMYDRQFKLVGGGSTSYQSRASVLFSAVSLGYPDLRGYEIESFTLRVDSLSIQSPGSDPNQNGLWTDTVGQFTLGIYAVPEPSACAMVMVAAGLLLIQRMRGDKREE